MARFSRSAVFKRVDSPSAARSSASPATRAQSQGAVGFALAQAEDAIQIAPVARAERVVQLLAAEKFAEAEDDRKPAEAAGDSMHGVIHLIES